MSVDQLLQNAIAHHQAGRLAQAEPLYRQVLAQRPNHPTALHLLGVMAGQVGRFDIAEALIRQAIAIHPREPFYHLNLGKFLVDAGKPGPAAEAFRQAIALNPASAEAHSHLGAALRLLGRHEEAIASHREALRLQPDGPATPDVLLNLGNALHSAGRRAEAIATYEEALRRDPNFVRALNNLGAVLRLEGGGGRVAEATGLFRRAIALAPDVPESHDNLGAALQAQGRLHEAVAAFRQALALRPDYPEALNNLGSVLIDLGELREALSACERAVALRPNFAEAHNNIGVACLNRGRVEDALRAFQQALRCNPEYVDAHCNLGNALKDVGDLAGAEAAFRKAVELDPAAADAHSNLLFTLHFDPKVAPRQILEEGRRWEALHAQSLAAQIRPHSNDPTPDRPLRIGLVSPDFREHCQALFTIPLLSKLDRAAFHVTAYSDVRVPDATTERLRGYVDEFRPVLGMPDEDLATLIRADRIDILIDLTMHMAHHRLRVFARKPAPVQVSWLAYPGTTGLSAIDYRLSDPFLDPPKADLSVYAERTVRLPHTFWCYDPQSTVPVNALPAFTAGHVTFGSLNNFCKVNDAVLDLWARALTAVSNSRLILLAPEGRHRERVLDRLAGAGSGGGITRDRVELVKRLSREDYLKLHHRIDLGLDTFPANGHTTSLDALWMGVPVVTFCPPTAPAIGRAGLCQLHHLGLPDLVAATEDAFVTAVRNLATDLPRLAALRLTLRGRMENSPLMDAERFARDFGDTLRTLWQAWCESAGGRKP
jgi:predicted O-linked N-acetylglucosamine transferase (SPINDLY family)